MENVYTEYIIDETIVTNDPNQSQVNVINPLLSTQVTNRNLNRDVGDGDKDGAGDGDLNICIEDERRSNLVDYVYEDKSSSRTRIRPNERAVIRSTANVNDYLSSPNYQPISPVESPLGLAVASALDDSYFPVSEESIEVENKRPEDYYDDTSQSQQSPTGDPFRPECQIPLPGTMDQYPFMDNRTFVRRRNERERTRVRNVNEGFERLRQHLPTPKSCKDKRLSKVETLREAINYIKHLQNLLKSDSNK